jgi:hypothetical protein
MKSKEEEREISDLRALATTAKDEGGKILINGAKAIIVATVDELANTYKEKTRDDLISLCARLQANLSLYQLLSGVDDQIEAITALYDETHS